MGARLRILLTLVVAGLAVSAADRDKLRLDGIAHVAFRVSDLAASREFYRKLGYEQAFEFSDAGGPTVSYMKINDRQFIELYRRTADSQPLGLMHICYDTSDMESLHSEYIARGLKPTATQKARAGNMLFTMTDPEGQTLEFTQYMPGSLHSNARGQFLGERRISQHLVRASAVAKDLNAERTFYTDKLGFAPQGPARSTQLRIAGDSGEEVRLETATPQTKPRIVMAVANLERVAADLKSRGITVRATSSAVMITDPDGATLDFVALQSAQ